ncbi:MAG: hypothetical protein K5656_07045 [Lachnospiraceae bacterium]|nr:hypothetical protein [Lachnospiraceae bacterium]
MMKVELSEIIDKIYSIPPLYALVVAVVLPFLVIAVGYIIGLIGEALGVILGMALHPKVSHVLINYVFFPGVMLHELAHAFLAVLTRAEITEVALFKHEGESLGHVTFRNRGNKVMVALQNIFASSAPMWIGGVVVYGCFYWIGILPKDLLWLKIILGYIGVSMFFHMTMSSADIKVYIRGIPLFIPMLFLVVLVLRLVGVL